MKFFNSSFEQTEKVQTFHKLNRKIKTERKCSRFKILTNRESSDFYILKRKTKQKVNFLNSKFQQTEKVSTFYKLKWKTKTEKKFSRFKILTNRIKQSTKRQHLIKFMLTFELTETDKHSIKILLRRKNLRFLRRTNLIKTRWASYRQ